MNILLQGNLYLNYSERLGYEEKHMITAQGNDFYYLFSMRQ